MGALVGAVVGDLLGIPHEFSHPTAIRAGRLMPTGGGPFSFPRGVGSDDTDLLFAAINAYDKHGFDADKAVDNMLAWFAAGPRDVGTQTAAALESWQDDRPPLPHSQIQGNGGLMRAAAHGIMASSQFLARDNAIDDTRLTHPSETAEYTSGHQAQMIWRLINTNNDLHSIMRPTRNMPDNIYRQLRPYRSYVGDPGGHCVHTLRLAMRALGSAASFEDGLSNVIRTGGDTDTNGAVAGALLGARFGERAIPADWVAAISPDLKAKIDSVREKFTDRQAA